MIQSSAYPISEIARKPLQKDLIRSLAVLKLWYSRGHGLDLGRFLARIKAGSDYDIADLRNLLRRDQNPDLPAMIARVVENFQFLGQMTDSERVLSADGSQRQRATAAALIAELTAT